MSDNLNHIPKMQRVRYAMLEDIAQRRCKLAREVHRTHRNVPLDFPRYPFQVELYKDHSQNIVIKGCTQRGKTEWAMCTTIAALTLDHAFNALYIMPDQSSLGRFVQAKFDPTKKNTDYYQSIVTDTDNRGVKKIGNGFVAFGISSRVSDFKEFTCDLVVIDELELCDQNNIKFARDRMSNSPAKHMIVISNPAFKNGPIDLAYKDSDQKKWVVDCPSCGERARIGWFEAVVRPKGNWFEPRSNPLAIVCEHCNEPVNPRKGYWHAYNPDHTTSGYSLNAVMSVQDGELEELYREFEEARGDMVKVQAFYNSRAGEAFTAPGAGIDVEMIAAAKEKRPLEAGIHSAGIDLHGHDQSVLIMSDQGGKPHIVCYEKCGSTAETEALLNRFNVVRAVSDSEPGGYFVREWAENQKQRGVKVALARNQESLYGFNPKLDDKSGELRFHRTMLLDEVWKHFAQELITVDPNISEQFIVEMTASTRYKDEDKIPHVYRWTGGDNHAMFSCGFALLASRMLGFSQLTDFRSSRNELPGLQGF